MNSYAENNVLNIVGFAPFEWQDNSVEWWQLNEWFEDFKGFWIKERKLRRKLMKLALMHPSWSIDLYHDKKPMYIQVRASSQLVEDEDEAERISRCHNKMYPLDFCYFSEEALEYTVATHNTSVAPLKVEWCIREEEKSKLTIL